jgi:hypothetical protein
LIYASASRATPRLVFPLLITVDLVSNAAASVPLAGHTHWATEEVLVPKLPALRFTPLEALARVGVIATARPVVVRGGADRLDLALSSQTAAWHLQMRALAVRIGGEPDGINVMLRNCRSESPE